MTELLYLGDAYCNTFDTTVKAAIDNLVALDCTAFFPGGGGQLGVGLEDLESYKSKKG